MALFVRTGLVPSATFTHLLRPPRQRSSNAPDDGKHLLGIVLAAIEDGLGALPFPTDWAARNISNQPRAAAFISGVRTRVLWRIRQGHPMGWGEL